MNTVNGRYPGRPAVLYPENMSASARIDAAGAVSVRVDDRSNQDFWLEVLVEKPECVAPEVSGDGVEYALAQMKVLRAMLDRSPIMLDRVNRAIAALEAIK